MIYIKTDSENRVNYTHYIPFDPIHGLGKTEAELLQDGHLVEIIPEPTEIQGKIHVLKFTVDKGVYYEYIDREPTDREKIVAVENQTAEAMVDIDFRISNIELGL